MTINSPYSSMIQSDHGEGDEDSSSWTNSGNLGGLITSLCDVFLFTASLSIVNFFIPNSRKKRRQKGQRVIRAY